VSERAVTRRKAELVPMMMSFKKSSSLWSSSYIGRLIFENTASSQIKGEFIVIGRRKASYNGNG
jgi:hypothetical protein